MGDLSIALIALPVIAGGFIWFWLRRQESRFNQSVRQRRLQEWEESDYSVQAGQSNRKKP